MKSTTLNIYGKNPISEMLERSPKNFLQIYIRDTAKGDFYEAVMMRAQKHRIPAHKVPQKKLETLVGEVNDQGIVATVKEFPYTSFDEWLESIDVANNPAVMILDEIEDPHNVGAIIRTATALGISAIIIPKHRQAGINATVYKTSAGAVGMIPIMQIGNLAQVIKKLKDAGFWIAGLDGEAKQNLWEEAFDAPFAFIVGSEGKGMREKTREACDIVLRVPMKYGVESLNASVAASLICYEWRRNKRN